MWSLALARSLALPSSPIQDTGPTKRKWHPPISTKAAICVAIVTGVTSLSWVQGGPGHGSCSMHSPFFFQTASVRANLCQRRVRTLVFCFMMFTSLSNALAADSVDKRLVASDPFFLAEGGQFQPCRWKKGIFLQVNLFSGA